MSGPEAKSEWNDVVVYLATREFVSHVTEADPDDDPPPPLRVLRPPTGPPSDVSAISHGL